MTLIDEVVIQTHHLHEKLKISIPANRWTVLASFTLTRQGHVKVISMATGTRCLPAERLESTGCVLFDSHAEVLSRRGFVRWALEEILRLRAGHQSDWLQLCTSGTAHLNSDVCVHLYVSTLPCKCARAFTLTSPYNALRRRRCFHSSASFRTRTPYGYSKKQHDVDVSITGHFSPRPRQLLTIGCASHKTRAR